MPPRRLGFTLIELLVVVAIIASLIAILLPSMSKSRELAKRVSCGSNLKQVGHAVFMYTNEFHGSYPPKRLANGHVTGVAWFGGASKQVPYNNATPDMRYLNPYLGAPAGAPDDLEMPVLRCPGDTAGMAYIGGMTHYEARGSSYSINANPAYDSLVKADGYTPINTSDVRHPSIFVLAGGHSAQQSVWGNAIQAAQGFWHVDPYQWNLLFADSHVAFKTVPLLELRGDGYNYRNE